MSIDTQNEDHIICLLRKIGQLCRENNDSFWADVFDAIVCRVQLDPQSCSEIRRIFGGSGSFNDLVLHDGEGKPLQAENNELERLRRELGELCWQIRIKERS